MISPWAINTRAIRSISRSRMQGRHLSTENPKPPAPPRLARLPIPPLRDTLDRYLNSIQPFLLEESLQRGLSLEDEVRKRAKWAQDFEHGLGKVCQERLHELDKSSPHNWLDDNFWLKKTYHESRSPLVINSNWWLALKHDPNVPWPSREGREAYDAVGITPWQLRRATWLLRGFLDFKTRVDSQELHPDTTRTGLWIRHATSNMFNSCRVPQLKCDKLTRPDLSSADSRKVLVMLYDWCYAIEVCDQTRKTFDFSELENRLTAIVKDANHRLAKGEKAVPVGILSADSRDEWAANRQYLLQLSTTNESTMRTIESSIMAISLDHYALGITVEEVSPRPVFEPDHHLHNARSGIDGHNRWFDKPITLIVESNTRASVMGEHSPCDALIPSIAAEHALAKDIDLSFSDPPSIAPIDHTQFHNDGWERLDWVVDKRIETAVAQAEKRVKAVIADSDASVMAFTHYGTDWIQGTAGLPADAFIQMAMQVAWYRMRNSFTAVYETALTRMFEHGRTETIRSYSEASRAFVLSMAGRLEEDAVRLELLQEAIKYHRQLTKEAMTGKGIDRHLMGLKLVMQDGESSDLFNDWVFDKSQEWKLSTSGLSAGSMFRGTGFGAPYHDGYGINYTAGPEVIRFGIESKYSCSDTSTIDFQVVLRDVLLSMRHICTQAAPQTQAKL